MARGQTGSQRPPASGTSSHGYGWWMPRRATPSHVRRRYFLVLQARGRRLASCCAHCFAGQRLALVGRTLVQVTKVAKTGSQLIVILSLAGVSTRCAERAGPCARSAPGVPDHRLRARPEQYRELRHLLRLWRLRAVAYSDPGCAGRLAAVQEAVRSGRRDGTPIEDVVPDWDEKVPSAQRRRAGG
jgi:hypothetical protein